MPDVDTLAEAAACNPEVVLIESHQQPSHAENGGWGAAVPARSVRRATARRASTRRATARGRLGDSESRIIEFLSHYPASTVGGIAKGLNLDPANVASHLTQLAKAGEIKKTAHGYSTEQSAPPRGPRRLPHHAH